MAASNPRPWHRPGAGVALVLVALLLPASVVLAGAPLGPSPTPAATPAAEKPPAPDSPRASVLSYLELARDRRWDEAARYLELSPADAARGPELAKRLKAVLDANVWIDPDEISPRPEGRKDDGLPPDIEELATIRGAGGARQPLRLVKEPGLEGGRWLFTRATVSRIDSQ
ncbi:MAG: hypothetical protein ACM3JH_11340, partial [Acidithiobacillales bacterium]